MGRAAKKYGESPSERERNGRKLKEVRIKLGLTARRAAELLNLSNTSAIVNCETACSSEMFLSRMKQYEQLSQPSRRNDGGQNSQANGSDQQQVKTQGERIDSRTKSMLEIAVRRLAKMENTSEVDIWLDLMDLSAQMDSH